jgi:hypothetical protein
MFLKLQIASYVMVAEHLLLSQLSEECSARLLLYCYRSTSTTEDWVATHGFYLYLIVDWNELLDEV